MYLIAPDQVCGLLVAKCQATITVVANIDYRYKQEAVMLVVDEYAFLKMLVFNAS